MRKLTNIKINPLLFPKCISQGDNALYYLSALCIYTSVDRYGRVYLCPLSLSISLSLSLPKCISQGDNVLFVYTSVDRYRRVPLPSLSKYISQGDHVLSVYTSVDRYRRVPLPSLSLMLTASNHLSLATFSLVFFVFFLCINID